jgi:hypothetical protein
VIIDNFLFSFFLIKKQILIYVKYLLKNEYKECFRK